MEGASIFCSFCAKHKDECGVVIAGPVHSRFQPFICDLCVDLCAQVVSEQREGHYSAYQAVMDRALA